MIFALQRLLQGCLVLFIISLIAFSIQGSLGDPLRELVGQSVSEQQRQELRQQLGLTDPFFLQYSRFIKNALQGDFGTSYFFKEPVTQVIFSKLPATIELVLIAACIIVFLSIPCGMFCAIRPSHFLSKCIMSLSILGISVPVFLTAIGLMYIFSIELGWLPSFGRGATVWLGSWESGLLTADGWRHIILPSIALASVMLPLFIRLVRSEMLEVMHKDYVKFAWAQGLSARVVWFTFCFKNTLLPLITIGGVQLGTMIAYTLLTETVFQWPGIGSLFLEAVQRVDTPIITAYIILVGVLFIVTNFIVDVLYHLANPTVDLFHNRESSCF